MVFPEIAAKASGCGKGCHSIGRMSIGEGYVREMCGRSGWEEVFATCLCRATKEVVWATGSEKLDVWH